MNARGAQKRREERIGAVEAGELSNWEERGDRRRRLSMLLYEKPIDILQCMEKSLLVMGGLD